MGNWTCFNCGRVFRSLTEFDPSDEVLCPECRAKIGMFNAQKEYWETMKSKAKNDKNKTSQVNTV